jgi:hypothetical protein
MSSACANARRNPAETLVAGGTFRLGVRLSVLIKISKIKYQNDNAKFKNFQNIFNFDL